MSQRISRVNELLKREIGTFVERNFEFPNILVTIHAVEVANDLKHAEVFIGVIGTADETRDVVETLNAKKGFIQNAVMKRVTLRNTPVLNFSADDSVERGVRVLNILEDIGEIDLPDEEPEN